MTVWTVERLGRRGDGVAVAGDARALAPLAEIVAVPDTAFDGAALLVSVTSATSIDKIKAALIEAGASVRSTALVGSHATRYTVPPTGSKS